jgi:hypothetical protein
MFWAAAGLSVTSPSTLAKPRASGFSHQSLPQIQLTGGIGLFFRVSPFLPRRSIQSFSGINNCWFIKFDYLCSPLKMDEIQKVKNKENGC